MPSASSVRGTPSRSSSKVVPAAIVRFIVRPPREYFSTCPFWIICRKKTQKSSRQVCFSQARSWELASRLLPTSGQTWRASRIPSHILAVAWSKRLNCPNPTGRTGQFWKKICLNCPKKEMADILCKKTDFVKLTSLCSGIYIQNFFYQENGEQY